MLWSGKIPDLSVTDYRAEAIRALNRKIADDMSVDVSMLTVGDGTTLVFKR